MPNPLEMVHESGNVLHIRDSTVRVNTLPSLRHRISGRKRWNQHEALAPSDIWVADIVEKAGDRRSEVMNARPANQ